jgi:O-antigen/teichoic acid export membrane protein
VGFSVLLIIGGLHGALLADPMLVFGPSRFAGRFPTYLRVLILAHWVLTVPPALFGLAVGFGLEFWGAGMLSPVLLSLAFAAPLYLLPMLLRRAFYVRMEPKEPAAASGLYVAVCLTTLFALSRTTELSAASGFLAMAAGGLVSSAWLLLRLRVSWSIPSRVEISDVLSAHWSFGRWGLGLSLAWWVRSNIYYVVLPMSGGLQAGAGFRAIVNLIMPAMQTIGAVGPLLLSAFTTARTRTDFGLIVGRVSILFGIGSIIYVLLVGCFIGPIIDWMYDGRYAEYANLIWIIGLIPILGAVGAAVGAAIRALERPDYDFWATAVSALAALTVGMWLVREWGVAGAVAGWTISYAISTLLMTTILLRFIARKRDPEPESGA